MATVPTCAADFRIISLIIQCGRPFSSFQWLPSWFLRKFKKIKMQPIFRVWLVLHHFQMSTLDTGLYKIDNKVLYSQIENKLC